MLSARRETGVHARPYLRNRDVQWGHVAVSDLPTMDFSPEDETRFRLASGDVLVCEGGEVGRAAIWKDQLAECYYQKALHRVRVSEALSPRYLCYLLEYYARTKAFAEFTSGSTIAHLPQEDLRNLPVVIPPRGEQGRIVAAIEQQFSWLDAGVAALSRATRRLRVLRDRDILALVAASGETRRLGDIAEIRLGRQRSPKNHLGPDMHSYLRAANVTWSGLDLRDVKQMNFSPSETSVYALRPGDVLVSEASGSASEVGKPAIWDGSIPSCCFQNTLLRVRSTLLMPHYLYFVLLAHARSGTFARKSKGVGIHHLSKSGLSDLVVPVPPQSLQKELAARASTRQATIQRLSEEVDRQLKRAHVLRSSILSMAFSGKLAPQDPADEPISTVLERIEDQRATSNGHRTPRSRNIDTEVTNYE
jgi:type I restriction enzyme S subunit